jgi:hypothetical protein
MKATLVVHFSGEAQTLVVAAKLQQWVEFLRAAGFDATFLLEPDDPPIADLWQGAQQEDDIATVIELDKEAEIKRWHLYNAYLEGFTEETANQAFSFDEWKKFWVDALLEEDYEECPTCKSIEDHSVGCPTCGGTGYVAG